MNYSIYDDRNMFINEDDMNRGVGHCPSPFLTDNDT